MNPHFGWIIVILGAFLVVIGILALCADQVPWLGRLPGDMEFKGEGFRF